MFEVVVDSVVANLAASASSTSWRDQMNLDQRDRICCKFWSKGPHLLQILSKGPHLLQVDKSYGLQAGIHVAERESDGQDFHSEI